MLEKWSINMCIDSSLHFWCCLWGHCQLSYRKGQSECHVYLLMLWIIWKNQIYTHKLHFYWEIKQYFLELDNFKQLFLIHFQNYYAYVFKHYTHENMYTYIDINWKLQIFFSYVHHTQTCTSAHKTCLCDKWFCVRNS